MLAAALSQKPIENDEKAIELICNVIKTHSDRYGIYSLSFCENLFLKYKSGVRNYAAGIFMDRNVSNNKVVINTLYHVLKNNDSRYAFY